MKTSMKTLTMAPVLPRRERAPTLRLEHHSRWRRNSASNRPTQGAVAFQESTWFEPEDIAQIKVLKTPRELAILGPRGVNGVIVITTKQTQGHPRQSAAATMQRSVTPEAPI